ncbi:hypothetical protein PUN28_017652 [Cardiocondyla obscurior]|uniref:Uncharacterized protein n=1 Tax=Cardiocondyla obscurior TaxID=286306 RepID=A0AAW2EL61_9HYME
MIAGSGLRSSAPMFPGIRKRSHRPKRALPFRILTVGFLNLSGLYLNSCFLIASRVR